MKGTHSANDIDTLDQGAPAGVAHRFQIVLVPLSLCTHQWLPTFAFSYRLGVVKRRNIVLHDLGFLVFVDMEELGHAAQFQQPKIRNHCSNRLGSKRPSGGAKWGYLVTLDIVVD